MSRLNFFSRPLVAFDPTNKDHRRWFAVFNRTGGWGDCPVRFIVPDQEGDLIPLCQRKLIQFYVNKEFGKIESCKT